MVNMTPVSNFDSAPNYYDATINFFDGSHAPSYTITPSLGGSADAVMHSTLFQEIPVVMTTYSGEIDYIDVRVIVNQLMATDSNGDTYTTTASWDRCRPATAGRSAGGNRSTAFRRAGCREK